MMNWNTNNGLIMRRKGGLWSLKLLKDYKDMIERNLVEFKRNNRELKMFQDKENKTVKELSVKIVTRKEKWGWASVGE